VPRLSVLRWAIDKPDAPYFQAAVNAAKDLGPLS